MALAFMENNEVKLKPAAFVGIMIILIVIGYGIGIALQPSTGETAATPTGNGTENPAANTPTQIPQEEEKITFEEGYKKINEIFTNNGFKEGFVLGLSKQETIQSNLDGIKTPLLEFRNQITGTEIDQTALRETIDLYNKSIDILKEIDGISKELSEIQGTDVCSGTIDFAKITALSPKTDSIKEKIGNLGGEITSAKSKYSAFSSTDLSSGEITNVLTAKLDAVFSEKTPEKYVEDLKKSIEIIKNSSCPRV